ncbi:sensor histidine kinase [Nonomuraea sp. NPDC050383]|uniref:sensor histidine kinase n=1 Tax=Nonomuraea sp. NPDC050383 TaxID=3364362 RepID=UPI0037912BBA
MLRQRPFGLAAWPAWSPRHPGRGWREARGLLVLVAFLAWPLWDLLRGRGHGGPLAIALMLVYGASWVTTMAYGVGRPPRERVAVLAWLLALAVALTLVRQDPAGHAPLGALAYALAAAVWLLPALWGLLLAVAAAAARLLILYATAGEAVWGAVPSVLADTLAPVAVVLLVRLLVQLRQANEEIEALATAAERARLARDLHDVLGHSLTAITAKAGLARRLLERGAEPDQALAELRDVERLSRQAHAEIRATVSGVRRPSLMAELSGVRVALRAADIAAVLPSSVEEVAEDLREPFAYVLREGVTNVIRHSGATRCEVRLDASSLEIRDDGHGGGTEAGTAGSGLAGLGERLRAVGGSLEAGPLPQGGFRLRASRP